MTTADWQQIGVLFEVLDLEDFDLWPFTGDHEADEPHVVGAET